MDSTVQTHPPAISRPESQTLIPNLPIMCWHRLLRSSCCRLSDNIPMCALWGGICQGRCGGLRRFLCLCVLTEKFLGQADDLLQRITHRQKDFSVRKAGCGYQYNNNSSSSYTVYMYVWCTALADWNIYESLNLFWFSLKKTQKPVFTYCCFFIVKVNKIPDKIMFSRNRYLQQSTRVRETYIYI